MERRGGQQEIMSLLQQGPVGGQADPESLRSSDLQQLPQLGVEQGLPHHMEVEKARMGAQAAGQNAKLLRRHEPLRPLCARAEGALEVADIGDLHIGPFEHGCPPLLPLPVCC